MGNTASQIVKTALKAATVGEADHLEALLIDDIGGRYERPLGGTQNNFGLIAGSGGSYEHKVLELVTNAQDAVLERLALAKFHDRDDVPYQDPKEAATALLGAMDYREQAETVTVELRASDADTKKAKRLTVTVRDKGCGIAPEDIADTIFRLGSSHKSQTYWQQGAFGLGGLSTYRNSLRVILVTRRMSSVEAPDRIGVTVVRWEQFGKAQTASYLTTEPWNEDPNQGREIWSVDSEQAPEFEVGTQISLISYGVEGFHRARSGDEKSFDTAFNTRLIRPIIPIKYVNTITRDKTEYLRGLSRRLEANPNSDRIYDEEEMLYTYGGVTSKLPVRFWVFPPDGEKGARRRFVAKNHALIFTSNGQVHHHWSQPELKQRTSLNKVYNRVLIEVETDALPIETRTALFSADRSEMLSSEAAYQLEDQVVDHINNWPKLQEINTELVKEAISRSSSNRSSIDVARKIAAALKVRGFSMGATKGSGGGSGGGTGRRPRKKIETFVDPTRLEGPTRLTIEDGKLRSAEYLLDAHDDFMDSGRGNLEFSCDHPEIDPEDHIAVGKLRDGYVRVQIHVPEGALEGTFDLLASVRDWELASGGMGTDLSSLTRLTVVDEIVKNKVGNKGDDGNEGAGPGSMVALIWSEPDDQEGWHNGVPGSVELVSASLIAEADEEYKELAKLGDQPIPTITLNKRYAPLEKYITRRAKDLTDTGVDSAKDRYAAGAGLGLVLLHEEAQKRKKDSKEPVDEGQDLVARQAIARAVLSMMPAFDSLVDEAGLV